MDNNLTQYTMNTRLAILLLLFSLSLRLSAQLPPGSQAPDFTTQDIKGQTWHLHGLLEQGKIVLLVFGATWCHPCWAYHNSQVLQQLFQTHGPEGSNMLQVLFVESDPNTNAECLSGQQGCSSFSLGNWVGGASFPFIDNAALADSFQVNYYPTIFIVCPNKRVYQVGQSNVEALWEKALECPVAAGTNNAGIYNYTVGTAQREVCQSLGVAPSFALVNLGTNPLTQASLTLHWNDLLQQTKQWQGYLPQYDEAIIEFDSMTLSGPGVLKTTIASINGLVGDDDFSNNIYFDHYASASTFSTTQIILKIKTDDFGAETYWELRDEQGAVLHKGGNSNVGPDGGGRLGLTLPGPGSYNNNTLINKTLALPGDGCYSILFVDAYGDGICCNYGNGYYRIFNANNPVIPLISGGEFGAVEHRGFEVASISSVFRPAAEPIQLRFYPNPSSDILHVTFSLNNSSEVSATIFNAVGQLAHQVSPEKLASGEHRWTFSLKGWTRGAYFIRLQAGDVAVMQKFVVAE
ncbi:MAG: T9SS type A sorting domain-containing protein [Saprospiraceae bacterium]|nr:T9SS type A sorting domain-containing protein [Saprospiraceae bacterium]